MDSFAEGDSSAYIPQDLLSTLTKDRKYISRRPKTSSMSTANPRSPEAAKRLKDESATILSSLNKRNEQPSYTPNKLHSSTTSSEEHGTAKPARVHPRVSSTSSSRSSSALSSRSDLMLVNESPEGSTNGRELTQLKAKLAKVESEKAVLERDLQQRANGVGEVQLEALKEQFSTQERLLGAYQRENEKSLTELSALRNREKTMAAHLLKLHGPNWEAQVFDSTTTRPSPVIRSNSRNPFGGSPTIDQTISLSQDSAISPSPANQVQSQPLQQTAQDNTRLLAHLASVQLLVQGMERRLIEAEEDMSRREKEARREGERARALMQAAK